MSLANAVFPNQVLDITNKGTTDSAWGAGQARYHELASCYFSWSQKKICQRLEWIFDSSSSLLLAAVVINGFFIYDFFRKGKRSGTN